MNKEKLLNLIELHSNTATKSSNPRMVYMVEALKQIRKGVELLPLQTHTYIIVKIQGDQFEYTTSNIKSFTDENKAQEYRDRIDNLYKKAYDFYNVLGNIDMDDWPDGDSHLYDLDDKADRYEGADFTIQKVPLI